MVQILDSSILVALFIESDTQHKKARDLWKKLRGLVYVPYCVISEVTTIITYKHSKEQSNAFIDFISNAKDVELIEDNLKREIDFYRGIKQRISFTDVALISLSAELEVDLITFDKQLEKIYKNKIIRGVKK